MKKNDTPLRIGIVGAGLSGLSVALALMEHKDFNGEVHLFEPRDHYEHDRHWSFWNVSEHFFGSIPQVRYKTIDFLKSDTRSIIDCGQYPYCVLNSGDVYDYCKSALAKDLRFYLHMGTSVVDVISASGHLELVLTEVGNRQFDVVFDSRMPATQDSKGFLQWFIGGEIAMKQNMPRIEPCLMGFCVGTDQPTGFFYVLPLDNSRVLVQLTYFLTPGESPPEDAFQIWSSYVAEKLGLDPKCLIREEKGCIPMRVVQTAEKLFGHHDIGAAAGWIRASTGYGFLDIQRAARRVADACCIKDPVERQNSLRMVKARSYWDDRLDRIFLETMKRTPDRAPEFFCNIFSHASSNSVIRFLSGTATWRDRIAVMASLPVFPFIKTLLSSNIK